jgi:acylglycerol lipase
MAKVILILLFLLILLSAIFLVGCKSKDHSTPISIAEIQKGPKVFPDKPQFLKTSDGIDLAYYTKIPPTKPVAVLIFIHGGGAYSGAGYQHLAKGLSEKYQTSVYLVDLRGHGNSGGPRGDAPSVEQVWDDLNLFITTVRKNNPVIPVFLGGHSSGAGLLLNYSVWNKREGVDGYFFVSPQLGYKSGTARENTENSFVSVKKWVFIVSAISGGRFFGNIPAVYFNYPEEVRAAQPLFLKSITVNMSLALTPNNPQEQFKKIDKPFGLFIGANDDLFVPEKVIQYATYAESAIQKKSMSQIIEKENHLSILLIADEWIGKTILSWQRERRP